jgi:hypothetical protein
MRKNRATDRGRNLAPDVFEQLGQQLHPGILIVVNCLQQGFAAARRQQLAQAHEFAVEVLQQVALDGADVVKMIVGAADGVQTSAFSSGEAI